MTSSPASSLRKSFGNIITKISNRGSIDGQDEIKQVKLNTQPCFACSSKGKKNIQCRSCSKIACILHSSVTSIGNTERSCDDCIHSTLQKDLSSSDTKKEKISSKIQSVINKRDELTKMMNKQNTKVRNLQTELKDCKEKQDKEKNSMISQLVGLQNSSKKMEKECEDWESEIKVVEGKTSRVQTNLGELEKESSMLKVNVDEMIKERTILLSNLNELRDFIRLQVPVRIIRKIVCSKCYMMVQNKFASNFKNVAPVKVEQQAKIAPQKKGACASCGIF